MDCIMAVGAMVHVEMSLRVHVLASVCGSFAWSSRQDPVHGDTWDHRNWESIVPRYLFLHCYNMDPRWNCLGYQNILVIWVAAKIVANESLPRVTPTHARFRFLYFLYFIIFSLSLSVCVSFLLSIFLALYIFFCVCKNVRSASLRLMKNKAPLALFYLCVCYSVSICVCELSHRLSISINFFFFLSFQQILYLTDAAPPRFYI
jgi:hypothetical protein